MANKRMGNPRVPSQRSGAAAIEFAIALPVLILILIITVDFGRLFYHYNTIDICARNGAMYACDSASPLRKTYASHKHAAMADGQTLSPPLGESHVSEVVTEKDAEGNYVEVTVTYPFTMVSSYLGFGTVTLQRTARMRVLPATPE